MAYYINIDECDGCGDCMVVCINNAIIDLYEFFLIDSDWCAECGSCAVFCTKNVIGYNGLDIAPISTIDTYELIEHYSQ